MVLENLAIISKDVRESSWHNAFLSILSEIKCQQPTGNSVALDMLSVDFSDLSPGFLFQEMFKIIDKSLFGVADYVGESRKENAVLALAVFIPGGDQTGLFSSEGSVPEIETMTGFLLGRAKQ